jgi:hypothetical protein
MRWGRLRLPCALYGGLPDNRVACQGCRPRASESLGFSWGAFQNRAAKLKLWMRAVIIGAMNGKRNFVLAAAISAILAGHGAVYPPPCIGQKYDCPEREQRPVRSRVPHGSLTPLRVIGEGAP